jgi:hypothetical protein
MNFIYASLVYLAMAVFLGLGIVMAVHGSPWLLIIAVVAYLAAFAKFGCLTQ